MARCCQISGTSHQCGNRVSHAKNRTKHLFQPNLQVKRLYVPEEQRYVTLKLTTRVIRTIDKIGLQATLKRYGLKLQDLA